MIVVRLKSGMGNQMFQYAFGMRMAKELGVSVKYDLSALLDRSRGPDFIYRNFDLDTFNLNIDLMHSEKLLRVLSLLKSSSVTRFFRERVKNRRGYFKEPDFGYQSEIIKNPKDGFVYEGWFQSYKYLEGIEEQIRIDFEIREELLVNSIKLADRILNCEAICVNVRRTDFVANENLNVTTLDYFERGVQEIRGRFQNPRIFIFSDDIKWCEEHLKFEIPYEIVNHSHKGFKFGNYMRLMSYCKGFVIPNSSFAWWSAWLSERKNKMVVAPKNWFNDHSIDTSDVTPVDWLRI